MPGRRGFIDDDAIFESNSLPIHWLICVAKIFVRTKYADFSSMTIGYRYYYLCNISTVNRPIKKRSRDITMQYLKSKISDSS